MGAVLAAARILSIFSCSISLSSNSRTLRLASIKATSSSYPARVSREGMSTKEVWDMSLPSTTIAPVGQIAAQCPQPMQPK
jgi:hypothetical protein